jgi:hypothetical protein
MCLNPSIPKITGDGFLKERRLDLAFKLYFLHFEPIAVLWRCPANKTWHPSSNEARPHPGRWTRVRR